MKTSLDGSKFPSPLRLPYTTSTYSSHSHPGYGCWLSGIDVSTQLQNQQFQDPWVAVVVRLPLFRRGELIGLTD